jgi:hypothetical protein
MKEIEVNPGEPHFTTRELARSSHLHQATIRRLFKREPGVLHLGAGRLRIPSSVAQRVFARLAIPEEAR